MTRDIIDVSNNRDEFSNQGDETNNVYQQSNLDPKENPTAPVEQSHNIDDSQYNYQPSRIYHERQSKQLCALHALNNLFQNPQAFRKQDLDAICKELAPDCRIFNPHRSTFGLGCYDVNVIISALAKKDFEVIWFDKRKDLSCLNLDKIFGFILNVPNTSTNGFFSTPMSYIPARAQIWYSQKHWIAVRKLGQYYYDLDSKLTTPTCLGDTETSLINHLRHKSVVEQAEILVIVPKCISEDQSWIKKSSE